MSLISTRGLARGTALSLVLVMSALVCAANSANTIQSKIDERLKSDLASKKYVGVVVGVIEDEHAAPRFFGFGTTSLEHPRTPDADTIFEIGSITKVFTSLALAVMVEEGQARLDEPVANLLPSTTKIAKQNGREITLEHLATHTSSLPRVPPVVLARALVGKDPYANVQERDVFSFLSSWTPGSTIGEHYSYSNLGTGLLGIALAKRAKLSFPELLRTKILDPLRLKDTGITLNEEQKQRLATPYLKGGASAKSWEFAALAGCGGLKSSASDMLRFLRANLDADHLATPLGRAMALSQRARHSAIGNETMIALGWHVTRFTPSNRVVVWHNGGTGGYRSFAGFEPKTRRAVVILCNTDTSVDNVGFDVLSMLSASSTSRETERANEKNQKKELRTHEIDLK